MEGWLAECYFVFLQTVFSSLIYVTVCMDLDDVITDVDQKKDAVGGHGALFV